MRGGGGKGSGKDACPSRTRARAVVREKTPHHRVGGFFFFFFYSSSSPARNLTCANLYDIDLECERTARQSSFSISIFLTIITVFYVALNAVKNDVRALPNVVNS